MTIFSDLGEETQQQRNAARQNPDQPFIAREDRHQTQGQLSSSVPFALGFSFYIFSRIYLLLHIYFKYT